MSKSALATCPKCGNETVDVIGDQKVCGSCPWWAWKSRDETTTAQTRSEHHADADAPEVRDSRRRVRRALERHAVGRDNAIAGSALAEHLPLKPTTVRDIIAEIRDAGVLPIGNCGSGYYVIDDRDELGAWVKTKTEEIATMRERRQTVVAAYNRREHGDPEQEDV